MEFCSRLRNMVTVLMNPVHPASAGRVRETWDRPRFSRCRPDERYRNPAKVDAIRGEHTGCRVTAQEGFVLDRGTGELRLIRPTLLPVGEGGEA